MNCDVRVAVHVVGILSSLMSQKTNRSFHIFNCTQQLQVRENVVGFEKALRTVK